MIQELDCVVLEVDIPEHGLTRGDVGAVVLVHSSSDTYDVEFVSFDGHTIALLTLTRSQIRSFEGGELPHVRNPSRIGHPEELGPRIRVDELIAWIEKQQGFGLEADVLKYAKEIKARQFLRQFTFDDQLSGLQLKRYWSFRDRQTQERYYYDIAQLPPEHRRKLIEQYLKFIDQLKSVRLAMTDYFAGQKFFDFYQGSGIQGTTESGAILGDEDVILELEGFEIAPNLALTTIV